MERFPGYTLVRTEDCPEQHGTLTVLTHDVSGATVLLVENEEDPVVWRGPVIAGAVKQFWTDVVWKDVDFLFVDMPPGTGDVPLTVFQSLPVDGIVVVASPQELVSMIVAKAVNMAEMMKVPMLVGMMETRASVMEASIPEFLTTPVNAPAAKTMETIRNAACA